MDQTVNLTSLTSVVRASGAGQQFPLSANLSFSRRDALPRRPRLRGFGNMYPLPTTTILTQITRDNFFVFIGFTFFFFTAQKAVLCSAPPFAFL